MNDNADPKGYLHCDIVAMITERYPHGVDRFAAHKILCHLAGVAGDLLGNGGEESFEAFCEMTYRVAVARPGKLKFVDGSVN